MKNIIKIAILFLFFVSKISFGQKVQLQGKIMDSLQVVLPFANVIADPEENIGIEFAISDEDGNFKLTLQKEKVYNITVSFLGYSPKKIKYKAVENEKVNFVLFENSESLAEVTVKYTPPVVVKKDTISYRVDAFTTGTERKLKDVLKKLPAVEVDKEGNISVQGKKVTKVLVENKEFFNGNSKLAVNNIPADAVDRIEVLDDYNEIKYLKNLEESGELAMNIKLKKDKKKFLFGDLEVGGGVKERYVLHPTFYFYSPKKTFNAIGDFNNIGEKSFTLKDYMEFEGGKKKLLEDAKGYFSLLNSDLASFLKTKHFKENKNQFGAINFTNEINEKLEILSYVIWSLEKNETKTIAQKSYTTSDVLENRTTKNTFKNNFGIGKFSLDFEPNEDTDLKYEMFLKLSENTGNSNLNSFVNQNQEQVLTITDDNLFSIKNHIDFHHYFDRKHTMSFLFQQNYQKNKPNVNWFTNQEVFQNLIPLVPEETYDIFRKETTELHTINVFAKHYWSLHRFHHLYFSLGNQNATADYQTSEFQVLEDDSINNFDKAGFGNDLDFNYNDFYATIDYKFRKGISTVKLSLNSHLYNWKLEQKDLKKQQQFFMLPSFDSKFEFKKSGKLVAKYFLKTRFPKIKELASNYSLNNFNNVFKGNSDLKNELFHRVNILYSKIKFSDNLYYSASFNWKRSVKNIQNRTFIEGIDFISTPFLVDFEDSNWNLNVDISREIRKIRFKLGSSVSYSKYELPVNQDLVLNKSKSYTFQSQLKSNFKDFPNFDISYSKRITEYESTVFSEFHTDDLQVYIEYSFLKNFILKADYNLEVYNDKTNDTRNDFNLANASLFYQQTDSFWSFEIVVKNIFDLKYKQQNDFSNVVITNQRFYILPRIALLKIAYKI